MQEKGVCAWDSLKNKVVLLILSVLALLGDNPMQSELSCHVGLNGNKFCRICKVETNIQDSVENAGAVLRYRDGDESDNSVNSAVDTGGGRKKKTTLSEMVQNSQKFLMVCHGCEEHE